VHTASDTFFKKLSTIYNCKGEVPRMCPTMTLLPNNSIKDDLFFKTYLPNSPFRRFNMKRSKSPARRNQRTTSRLQPYISEPTRV
jgi:hypothetical protein